LNVGAILGNFSRAGRSYQDELSMCHRFYVSYFKSFQFGGSTTPVTYQQGFPFYTVMRATPVISMTSPFGNTSVLDVNAYGVSFQRTDGGVGGASAYSADAEI